jgi:catechol 2,3-dioxygenase-like lactoylglutathione lyase family enzyme
LWFTIAPLRNLQVSRIHRDLHFEEVAATMPTNLGRRILPCLLVSDMRRSLEFYLEVMGFTQTGYYPIESEPIRTEVRRDDVAIILYTEAVHGRDEAPAFTGALYFFPQDIDPLAEELQGKVTFAWGPEATEFGIREFAVRDPDGYALVFAERAE